MWFGFGSALRIKLVHQSAAAGSAGKRVLAIGLFLAVITLGLGCGPATTRSATEDLAHPTSSGSGLDISTDTHPQGGDRQGPAGDERAPAVPPKSAACPKLESVLYQLSLSSDAAREAAQQGVDYQAGRVRVVIDLKRPGATLPPEYKLMEERRGDAQVRVMAPLDQLCALSELDEVAFVHLPLRPLPSGPGQ